MNFSKLDELRLQRQKLGQSILQSKKDYRSIELIQNKIIKLLGEKNKNLDSEFLYSKNSFKFDKSGKGLNFKIPCSSGPMECKDKKNCCLMKFGTNGKSFSKDKKRSKWNLWVKTLRIIMKPKRK